MDYYSTLEFARPPEVCEGRTVPLCNWEVLEEPEQGAWCLVHYVGGEEYEIYLGLFDTQQDAQDDADYLNSTLPPIGYTHYYTVE